MKFYIPAVIILILTISHQNCAPDVMTRDEYLKSLTAETPFAFDTTFNRVAYMSCSEMNMAYTYDAFFTLRIGAREGTGVKITSKFNDYSKQLSEAEAMDLLKRSPRNSNAQLILAVRPDPKDLSTILSDEGLSEGDSIDRLSDFLDSDPVAKKLFDLTSGSRLYDFSDPDITKDGPLTGSLRFLKTEGATESVRTEFNSEALLTLTYSSYEEIGEPLPRSYGDYITNPTPSELNKVFGTGLSLQFSRASGENSNRPGRVMVSAQEINLETKKDLGEWTCPAALQFLIVPWADVSAGKGNCHESHDKTSLTEEQQVVRDLLDKKYWVIDWEHKCAFSKGATGDCYGTVTGNIEYNSSTACGGSGQKLCPHYMSFCYK